jgi:hypothetical protein
MASGAQARPRSAQPPPCLVAGFTTRHLRTIGIGRGGACSQMISSPPCRGRRSAEKRSWAATGISTPPRARRVLGSGPGARRTSPGATRCRLRGQLPDSASRPSLTHTVRRSAEPSDASRDPKSPRTAVRGPWLSPAPRTWSPYGPGCSGSRRPVPLTARPAGAGRGTCNGRPGSRPPEGCSRARAFRGGRPALPGRS